MGIMFQYLAASSRPKGKVVERSAVMNTMRSIRTKNVFWPWQNQSHQFSFWLWLGQFYICQVMFLGVRQRRYCLVLHPSPTVPTTAQGGHTNNSTLGCDAAFVHPHTCTSLYK